MYNRCKHLFCIKHFNKHRHQLLIKFDDEVVKTHAELLEKVTGANQWEATSLDKVHRAAE